MIGLSILFILIGAFLLARPELWLRFNAPIVEKGKKPTGKALRSARRNGVLFVVGGILLLIVQYYKGTV